MADITQGLPTLRPEDIQAQADRARIDALGATLGTGAKRIGAAAMDIGSLPLRAILGATNTAIRLPNAFGANIPYAADNGLLSSMTPYSDALTRGGVGMAGAINMPTMPAAVAAAAPRAGGATGAWEPAATTIIDPATKAPVGKPTPPVVAAKNARAAMPAAAPAPLVPGETGFYMNDTLVPYGQMQSIRNGEWAGPVGGGSGGGDAQLSSLPGGGKMKNGQFIDYRDAVEYGLQAQRRMFDTGMTALSGVNGGDLGAGSRMRAIAQMLGTNNFGSTAVGGANTINQAIAHITGAEISGEATLGAAGTQLTGTREQIAERKAQFGETPQPIGMTSVVDPATGLMTNQTHMGMPSTATRTLIPMDATVPKAKPKEGATGKSNGRAVVYRNGEWVAQ